MFLILFYFPLVLVFNVTTLGSDEQFFKETTAANKNQKHLLSLRESWVPVTQALGGGPPNLEP